MKYWLEDKRYKTKLMVYDGNDQFSASKAIFKIHSILSPRYIVDAVSRATEDCGSLKIIVGSLVGVRAE